MFYKISELSHERKRIAILLLCLITLNILFIFSQSMLSREISGAESGAIRALLENIFSYDRPFGAFVLNNLRKIAHFAEFALLGVWVSLYVCFYALDRRGATALSFVFGHLVAFADETIQIFSGRGPAILDVWIDTLGFVTSSVGVYAIFFCTCKANLEKEIQNG